MCGGGGGARWAWVACALLWGLSQALLVPMIAAREGNEVPGKCFQFKRRRGARLKAYVNAALVVLFWAVFAVLVVSYGKVAARLLRAARRLYSVALMSCFCFLGRFSFELELEPLFLSFNC